MATRFQQIKDYAESKGGRASIGRIVIAVPLRTGVVAASVQPEWDAPDVDGEHRLGGTVGPYPISVVADDPEFQALVAEIHVESLQSIELLQDQLAGKSDAYDQLAAEKESLTQELQSALQSIAQLTAERDELTRQVAASQPQ